MEILYNVIVIVYFSIAALMDLKHRRIRNAWIIIGYFFAVISSIIFKRSFILALYGLLMPLPLIFFYQLKMIGAGDIKLLSVAGSILGINQMIVVVYYILSFSVILALFSVLQFLISKEKSRLHTIPLAIAIFLGIITYIFVCKGKILI